MGRDVDATDDLVAAPNGRLFCPRGDVLRASLEAVDPCVDIPIACRDASCDDPIPPGDVCLPTTTTGSRRAACGDAGGPIGAGGDVTVGAVQARDKLIGLCSIYGRDVPNGDAPSRYCFLSCVQDLNIAFRPGEPAGCDPTLFDPPEVTQSSFFWELDPESSSGTVTTGSEVVPLALAGEVALHAPNCGPLRDCAVTLPWVNAYVPHDVVVGGYIVHEVMIHNPEPLRGATIMSGTATTSEFALAPGSVFYLVGNVEGHGPSEFVFTSPEALHGELDWIHRTFVVTGTFVHPSGVELAIELHGALPNLLPVAHAGPDQLLECESPRGAVAHLSALASTDPDGGIQDMISAWWNTHGNAFELTVNGFTANVLVPRGTREYDLTVSDRWGAMSTDEVVITVTDTVGPVYSSIETPSGDCLQPLNGRMRLFRLGDEIVPHARDRCSLVEPTYRIVDVRSNQVDVGAPDVVFGASALCVRAEQRRTTPAQPAPRTYTVTVEATDDSGNTTRRDVYIHVPDLTESCENGPSIAPTVADDDPRCLVGGPVEPPPPGCQCGLASNRQAGLGLLATTVLLMLVVRRRTRPR